MPLQLLARAGHELVARQPAGVDPAERRDVGLRPRPPHTFLAVQTGKGQVAEWLDGSSRGLHSLATPGASHHGLLARIDAAGAVARLCRW